MYNATCLCGACHIAVSKIIASGNCHCLTCRKMSSSAFTINAVTQAQYFELKSGTPKTIILTGDSGTKSTLYFCPDCGSSLWTEWPPMPDLRVLKAGLLDGEGILDDEALRPLAEQFTSRRPTWLCAVEGAAQCKLQQGVEDATAIAPEIDSARSKSG